MNSSANRTATTSLSVALLLLAALPAGCIADTTRSPESTDTGLHSDIQQDTPDSADDPDQDGIPSSADLCPENYDPRQNDWDKDGAGDACDPTIDLNESNALVMRDLPVQEYSEIQLSSIGDFNADGYPDFAVGVPALDEERGQVLLFSGGTLNAGTGSLSMADSTGTLRGEFENDLVGCELNEVGDVNGDGFDDFAVLQCQRINRQGVHLILGQENPNLTGRINNISEMKFAIARKGEIPNATILQLEAIDRGGMLDFAIASWNWMRVIRVIPGSTSFPDDVGQGDLHFLDEWTMAASTIEIPEPTANDSPIQFAPLGDVDGNGILEFGMVDSLESNGPAVDVYMLSADEFPTEIGAAATLASIAEGSEYPDGSKSPQFTSLGDLNGDGLADFSFSEPGDATTEVFFGSTSGINVTDLSSPDTKILHSSNAQLLGGLDVNSDGFSDLIFAQDSALSVFSGNRSWGTEMSASGPDGFDATVSFPSDSDVKSYAIESIKDFDGDNTAEFGIVLEGTDRDIDSGRIWVVDTDLPLQSH